MGGYFAIFDKREGGGGSPESRVGKKTLSNWSFENT